MGKQQTPVATEYAITTKQQNVIDIIQSNLNITFVGNTKKMHLKWLLWLMNKM